MPRKSYKPEEIVAKLRHQQSPPRFHAIMGARFLCRMLTIFGRVMVVKGPA
jgi:hypothetical protein